MSGLIGEQYEKYVEPGEITQTARDVNKLGAVLPLDADVMRIRYYKAKREGKLAEYWKDVHDKIYGKEENEIIIETSENKNTIEDSEIDDR